MGLLLLLPAPNPPVLTPPSGVTLNDYTVALGDLGYDRQTTPMASAVNAARRRLLRAYRWPFLEQEVAAGPLTVGDPIGDLSEIENLIHLDAVRLEEGSTYVNLTPLNTQQLRALEHVDREVGAPEYWTRHGNAIRIHPSPDREYTVVADVILYPGDLVQPGDLDIIPAIYQDVVTAGALASLAYRQRDWHARDRAEQSFLSQLQDMARAEGVLQRQSSGQVVRTGIWDDVARP